ncbi:hypothetical protein [Bacteroides eggerthii]|uniref:hypothetical protein n=1 Tax=Bacteroides eggerthii TaxID=28111 RepID=UPI001EF808F5|nr:hypothetical protein [Bacteroides eggerthii]MCG4759068.1 hypothetical protein [Bacteroides eggerthii]
MNQRCHTNPVTPYGTGLSITGGPFCFPRFTNPDAGETEIKGKGMGNTGLAYRELQGKVGKCFFSDGKVGPRGFGKNHPRRAAVFFPKTLPYRKHLPPGPCSSTGCQSPSIHN